MKVGFDTDGEPIINVTKKSIRERFARLAIGTAMQEVGTNPSPELGALN